MTAQEMVKQKALSLVGQGYIYGAKGQICSANFRQQQAQQYPEQAHSILNTGAKWDGKPVWDCAQLTRAAAKAAGFSLVSGATSQWQKTPWISQGAIDTLPPDAVAFVYRQSEGRMQHTGVALGDGTCVHARGTAYGVVHQPMSEYAWTHWASLWETEARKPELTGLAEVWAQNGSTVNVRREPGGSVMARLPVGTLVETGGACAGWTPVAFEETRGYMQSAFLRENVLIRRLLALDEEIRTIKEKAGW